MQSRLSQACAALVDGPQEGRQPFTLQRVQYACYLWMAAMALDFLRHYQPGPRQPASRPSAHPPPAAAEAASAVQSALQASMRLEPHNPSALHLAAQSLPGAGPQPLLPQHASVRHLLQGVRLAQAQRSDFWVVQLAGTALINAVSDGPAAALQEVQAAIEAIQQAEAALARCKRLLPHPWVNMLHVSMALYRSVLPAAHAQLNRLQAEQRGDRQAAAAASTQFDATLSALDSSASEQSARIKAFLHCASCGQRAVGLRACARCRAVQ